MKTTIDAMKQALEAITIASLRCVSESETCTVLAANAALRDAIAREEAQTVEPVAWMRARGTNAHYKEFMSADGKKQWLADLPDGGVSRLYTIPLFTHPARHQVESGRH